MRLDLPGVSRSGPRVTVSLESVIELLLYSGMDRATKNHYGPLGFCLPYPSASAVLGRSEANKREYFLKLHAWLPELMKCSVVFLFLVMGIHKSTKLRARTKVAHSKLCIHYQLGSMQSISV